MSKWKSNVKMLERTFIWCCYSKQGEQETSVEIGGTLEYQPLVLSDRALQILDIAITARSPKPNYDLQDKVWCKPLHMLKVV